MRRRRSRSASLLTSVVLIALVGLAAWAIPRLQDHSDASPESPQIATDHPSIAGGAAETVETVEVLRVVDGDTIRVNINGQDTPVRYIGVDTPETVAPNQPVACFGREASAKNKELVEGKRVRLESDVSDTDRFGRLLRYVWIGDQMVNEVLVREGYAQVVTYPPDVKYVDRFLEAQQEASGAGRGLWTSC